MAQTVLITGATGNTGGALGELLVQRGVGVRALLRRGADAAKFQGATVALADLDVGLPNEETERHPDILVCRGPRPSWPEMWAHFQYFG